MVASVKVNVVRLDEMRLPALPELGQVVCTVNTPFSYPINVPEDWSTEDYNWLCITENDKLVHFREDDNVFVDEGVVHYVQVSSVTSNA